MFKNIFSIIFCLFFTFKVNSEIVNQIVVENNDRVPRATIISFSGVKIGDDLYDIQLNNIIKELYDTNFFSDVSVQLINGKLSISVLENKIIQSMIINGIKADKFKEAILDNKTTAEFGFYITNRQQYVLTMGLKLHSKKTGMKKWLLSSLPSE